MRTNRMKSGGKAVGALILAVALNSTLSFGQQTADRQGSVSEGNAGSRLLLASAAAPSETSGAPAAPAPAPPPSGSAFSWTGIYVGINVGSGTGDADTQVIPLPSAPIFVNLAPTTLRPDPNGIIGGGQAGINWQRGLIVVGAEFDLDRSGIDGTQTVTPITQNNGTPFPGAGNHLSSEQSIRWMGTVRPRVGLAFGRLFIFGTGGLAFANVSFKADADFRPVGTEHYPADFSKTKQGSVYGGGAEFAINRHWSVKGDFLVYDLGSETFVANPAIPLPPFQISYTWQVNGTIGRAGLNFRF